MRALAIVACIPLAGAAVYMGGEDGAGIAALLGMFLVAFMLLLFRREGARRAGALTRAEEDFQFVAFIVLAGLFVRTVLAMGLRHAGLNQVIAPDEYTFHDNGRYFLGWLQGEFAEPFSYRWRNSTQVGYFALVGGLYWLFGVHEVVPVLVNCLIGALAAVPAYRLASQVGGRRAGRYAAVLVTFFPSLVLWSTLLIRDALVLLLILWCTVFAQSLLRRFTLRGVLLLVACLAGLATLRSYVFVMQTGGMLLAFLVAGVRRPGRAVATAVLAGLGAVMVVKGLGVGGDALAEASLEHISTRRQLNSVGQSGMEAPGHDLDSPLGALTYLPIGLVWFLFAPFPWQVGGRQAMAVPDVLVWYLSFPLVVYGVAVALRRRRRPSMAPLLVAALFTVIHSLVEGNVGIIVRHRAHVLVLLLPFAGFAAARFVAQARKRREELRHRHVRYRTAAAST